jgi:hypothetical protein
MSRRRYFAIFLFLIFATAAGAQTPPTCHSQIDAFADRLASDIQKSAVPQRF